MTTGPQNYEDEIRDTWEGAGLSIPAVSFAEHVKGDGFKDAILLPTGDSKSKFFGKGYRMVPDMEKRNVPGPDGKQMRNPNFGQPRRWPDGRIMQTTVLTLLTPLKTLDHAGFLSEPAIEKFDLAAKADDPEDIAFIEVVKRFGLRRVFIQGESMDKGFKEAVKALSKGPIVAAQFGLLLAALTPNTHGGKTKEYKVDYALPTPASIAAVEEYIRSGATIVNEYLDKQAPAVPAAVGASQTGEHASEEDTPF